MPGLSLLLISNSHFASYGPLACKNILSISGSWFFRLINAFVFPDLEPPEISGWAEISGVVELCYYRLPFVI